MPGILCGHVEIHAKTEDSDTKALPALTAELNVLNVLKGCREFLPALSLREDSEQHEDFGPPHAEQTLHPRFAGRRQPFGR